MGQKEYFKGEKCYFHIRRFRIYEFCLTMSIGKLKCIFADSFFLHVRPDTVLKNPVAFTERNSYFMKDHRHYEP